MLISLQQRTVTFRYSTHKSVSCDVEEKYATCTLVLSVTRGAAYRDFLHVELPQLLHVSDDGLLVVGVLLEGVAVE